MNLTNITTPYTAPYSSGTVLTITAPATAVISGSTYNFSNWEDGTTVLTRTVTMTKDTALVATYTIKTFVLTVNSNPQGITFTVQ